MFSGPSADGIEARLAACAACEGFPLKSCRQPKGTCLECMFCLYDMLQMLL